MRMQVRPLLAFAFVPVLMAACSQSSAPRNSAAQDATGAAPQTALGRLAANAIGEARAKLATENLNLNGEMSFHGGHSTVIGRSGRKDPADTRPDAELTPTGDLLIDGKMVPVDAAQHAMLVRYRQALMNVAEAGMQLGVQGADLGGQAVSEVFNGLMSGHPDQIDKNINAKAGKIEAQAIQLCKDLRPVQEQQQQLAAAIPQFAPYATMKESDIEDCGKHRSGVHATVATDADRAEIQEEIRHDIRESVRGSVGADTPAADSAPASATTR